MQGVDGGDHGQAHHLLQQRFWRTTFPTFCAQPGLTPASPQPHPSLTLALPIRLAWLAQQGVEGTRCASPGHSAPPCMLAPPASSPGHSAVPGLDVAPPCVPTPSGSASFVHTCLPLPSARHSSLFWLAFPLRTHTHAPFVPRACHSPCRLWMSRALGGHPPHRRQPWVLHTSFQGPSIPIYPRLSPSIPRYPHLPLSIPIYPSTSIYPHLPPAIPIDSKVSPSTLGIHIYPRLSPSTPRYPISPHLPPFTPIYPHMSRYTPMYPQLSQYTPIYTPTSIPICPSYRCMLCCAPRISAAPGRPAIMWGRSPSVCYAMPCHAKPCHPTPRHAGPPKMPTVSPAALSHALPCHAMPCHAMHPPREVWPRCGVVCRREVWLVVRRARQDE